MADELNPLDPKRLGPDDIAGIIQRKARQLTDYLDRVPHTWDGALIQNHLNEMAALGHLLQLATQSAPKPNGKAAEAAVN